MLEVLGRTVGASWNVLVEQGAHKGVPVGLAWVVHFKQSFEVGKERLTIDPRVHEFVSLHQVQQQLKVCHFVFFLRRLVRLIDDDLDIQDLLSQTIHEFGNEDSELVRRQIHFEQVKD